jgi:hypothetical protein
VPAAALVAEDRVELCQRDPRQRIVPVHEHRERDGLAGRGEAAGRELDTERIAVEHVVEAVVVGDIRVAPEQRDVRRAGVEAGHREARGGQARLDLPLRMHARESRGPRLQQSGHRRVAPDAQDRGVVARTRERLCHGSVRRAEPGPYGEQRRPKPEKLKRGAHHCSFLRCFSAAAGLSGR